MSTDPRRRSLAAAGVFVFVFVLTVCVGCVGSNPQVASRADALETLPFESIQDWRSYADLVAVVEVAGERSEVDPAARGVPLSDPLRYVTLTIDHVLWARSGDAPKQVEMLIWGWRATPDGVVDVLPPVGPRVEVGGRYVIGMTLGRRPGPMTASSVLPLEGDRIGAIEPELFASSLAGLTVQELEDRVLATKPDPIAAEHEDLPPAERYALVAAAAEGAGS